MKESEKDDIEFVEAREDAAEALETTEEPLDFVAPAIHGLVVLPRFQSVRSRWNNGDKTKVQSQLQGLVVVVGAVHHQMQGCWQGADAAQQLAAFDGIGGLSRGKGKGYGRASICGNQMNLGSPSAARLADGLRSVFFNAPVPSG